eukprot:g14971.t1
MTWKANRSSPAVITITIDHLKKVTDEQWVFLKSDDHWDNPKCHRHLLEKHLKLAVARNAPIIGGGDLFCAMQGKYDKRSCKSDLRPEHQNGRYLDSLVDTAADWYAPYAKNMVCEGRGNHETAIAKRHETDLTDRVCAKLRGSGGITEAMGYGYWVRFHLKRGAQSKSYRMKVFHGSGGGGPVTKGVIQTNRRAVFLPDADIVMSGHVHESWSVCLRRERINEANTITHDSQWHVCTPSYKEEYGDGHGGWHVERGAPPKPLGGYWLRFFYENPNFGPISQTAVLFGRKRISGSRDYMAWAQTYYRRADGTQTPQVSNVRNAIRELNDCCGHAAVSSFGLREINQVQHAMVESGRLCRSEVNRRISIIKQMFAWAANQGLTDDLHPHRLSAIQPLKRGRTQAREPERVQSVTWEVVSETLPHLDLKWATMVELQWNTGMRPGEVCAMHTGEIHPTSSEVWHFCPAHHKTAHYGITRKISLGPVAINLIRAWLPRVKGEWLFEGGRHKPSGKHVTVWSYRNAVMRVCKARDIEHWHPNQIRHSKLTEVYNDPAYDLKHAQQIAGHTTRSSTERYIDRPTETTLADLVARERG